MAPSFGIFNLGSGSAGGSSELGKDLRKATEANAIDVPKDVMMSIVQASHKEDDRRTIMRHIAVCLGEAQGAKWRRVYLALSVLEELLKKGAPALVTEAASGFHFDIVQRMSFIEAWEYLSDKRVESLVRQKASRVKVAYQELQLQADESGATASKSAEVAALEPGRINVSSFSSNGQSAKPEPVTAKKERPRGSHMLVRAGHNEDTTDEESDDESARRTTGGYAQPPAARPKGTEANKTARNDMLDDSTADGDSTTSSSAHSGPSPTPPPLAAMDLLEMDAGPSSTEHFSANPQTPPTACDDLLGFDSFGPGAAAPERQSPSVAKPAATEALFEFSLADVPQSAPEPKCQQQQQQSNGPVDWLAVANSKGLQTQSHQPPVDKDDMDWMKVADPDGIHKVPVQQTAIARDAPALFDLM